MSQTIVRVVSASGNKAWLHLRNVMSDLTLKFESGFLTCSGELVPSDDKKSE